MLGLLRDSSAQVIVFIGDFTSSASALVGAQSVSSSCQFRFGELGAVLCAPELDIGTESVASLTDFVSCDGKFSLQEH